MRVLVSDDFNKTLVKFADQKDRIKLELRKFVDFKNSNPANGSVAGVYSGFGDSDRRFRSKGKFANKIDGISHAHLTHNISIVYLVDDGVLYLYGIYSHDDIGTGSPGNINRQEQMATRWANMNFNADLVGDAPLPSKPEVNKPKPTGGSKPQTTQMQKPQAPQTVSKFEMLIRDADQLWPQRNMYEKLKNSPNVQSSVNIISQEAHYLKSLKQQGKRLFPNQIEYMETLEKIAIVLLNKKKP
jgi:hypothetical protein